MNSSQTNKRSWTFHIYWFLEFNSENFTEFFSWYLHMALISLRPLLTKRDLKKLKFLKLWLNGILGPKFKWKLNMKIQYYVFLSTETKHYGTWFSFWVQFYPPKSHKNKNTPSFSLNNNTAFFIRKKRRAVLLHFLG